MTDRPRHILIAEDSPIMQEYFRNAFGEFGFDLAQDGEDLLFMAFAKPYNLILADLTMPILGGSDAVLRIRRDPGPNQHTAIYALTGDLYEEVIEKAKGAGFDFVFTKPELTYARLAKLFAWASRAQ